MDTTYQNFWLQIKKHSSNNMRAMLNSTSLEETFQKVRGEKKELTLVNKIAFWGPFLFFAAVCVLSYAIVFYYNMIAGCIFILIAILIAPSFGLSEFPIATYYGGQVMEYFERHIVFKNRSLLIPEVLKKYPRLLERTQESIDYHTNELSKYNTYDTMSEEEAKNVLIELEFEKMNQITGDYRVWLQEEITWSRQHSQSEINQAVQQKKQLEEEIAFLKLHM